AVAGSGEDTGAEAGEDGGGGFFGEGAAGGELAADERDEGQGRGFVPNELMAAGDGGRSFGIDVGERADAALVHDDVGPPETGGGKDVGDDGHEVFELLLGGDGGGRIAFEGNVGRANERAVAKGKQKHGAAVAGFGVHALT